MAHNPARFSPAFIGAKNAPGTYHRIINLIPPCGVFFEPFAGTAAITRIMRPVRETILIDKVNRPELRELCRKRAGARFIHGDAIPFLSAYKFRGEEMIYADPPYLLAARNARGRAYYAEEMSDADHERLLILLRKLNCRVLLSGYRSPLYDDLLCDWQREEFEVVTRGGTKAKEVLWWNYPRPVTLHDYQFVGETWKKRANIRRKIKRAVADLASMPALERHAMFAALAASVGLVAAKAPTAALAGSGEGGGGAIGGELVRAFQTALARQAAHGEVFEASKERAARVVEGGRAYLVGVEVRPERVPVAAAG